MTVALTDNGSPMNIIHKAIVIIINAITRNLLSIDPHIGAKVRVVVVNPRINYRNNNRLAAACRLVS